MKSNPNNKSNSGLRAEYTILLSKAIDLSSLQKQLVLEQVRAVYNTSKKHYFGFGYRRGECCCSRTACVFGK